MVRCEHGEGVGADLVGRVSVRGDAVGAGDDAVDLSAGHQGGRGRVGDYGVRDAGGLQLPGGEARALQERAGLVHPHVREQSALPGCPEGTDRAAVASRREPPGVAMR